MLRCVLGERKIGKSIYVENWVKNTDIKALYVATLPQLEIYEKTISEHQKRRPHSWECIELFRMTAEEILTYPYQDYRNIILDNLSYYVMFQVYSNKDELMRKCDERFILLIDRIAKEKETMVHFIDTPVHQDIFEVENGITRRLFSEILEKAVEIERFYGKDKISTLNIKEAKSYFLNL